MADDRFWHPNIYEWRQYCELHPECDPHCTLMLKDGTPMVVWAKDKPVADIEEGKRIIAERKAKEQAEKEEERKRKEIEQREALVRTQEEMHKEALKRERKRQTLIHRKEAQPEKNRVQAQKQAIKRKAFTTDDPFEASVLNAVDKDRLASNGNYIVHARRLSELPKIPLSDPEAIHERVDFYFQLCMTDGIRPNLPGLAMSFGLTRTGLQLALGDMRMSRECREELGRGVVMMDNIMSAMALDGKINPVSAIYFMNNWLGYKNASEVTTRTESVDTSVDQKALEQKYNAVIDME